MTATLAPAPARTNRWASSTCRLHVAMARELRRTGDRAGAASALAHAAVWRRAYTTGVFPNAEQLQAA